ncbi:MAG: hypothetical protein ACRDH8_11705 [Actinomycetota bacterium]
MRAYVVILMAGSGLGILAFWTFLLVTGNVPETRAGKRSMRFHIAAELLLAVLLLGAGIALLAKAGPLQLVLSGAALGALAYTAVNSPGYYVDLGGRVIVWMFAVLLVLSGVGIAFVLLLA